MKKLALFLFLISFFSCLIYPVIMVPPQRTDMRMGEAIGSLVGITASLIANGVAADKVRKQREEQERNAQRASMEITFELAKQQSLKKMIGYSPKEEQGKGYLGKFIILLILGIVLLTVFVKKLN